MASLYMSPARKRSGICVCKITTCTQRQLKVFSFDQKIAVHDYCTYQNMESLSSQVWFQRMGQLPVVYMAQLHILYSCQAKFKAAAKAITLSPESILKDSTHPKHC